RREVDDKIADVVVAQSDEETFGHHRDFRDLELEDVFLGDGHRLRLRADREPAARALAQKPREDAHIPQDRGVELVVSAYHRARIEDVLEDIVEVGSIRSGELGPDVAAGIEEAVALRASALEKRAPPARIAGREALGGELRLRLGDEFPLVLIGRAHVAPHIAKELDRASIAERPDLPGMDRRDRARRDLLPLHRIEERDGPRGPRHERADRVGLLGAAELRPYPENRGSGPIVVERGERTKDRRTERFVIIIEQLVEELGETGRALLDERRKRTPPRLGRRLLVGERVAKRLERLRIIEAKGERERPLPHLAALALREHDVGTGPGVRHGDVRSAAEPFLEPREQLETQLVVVVVVDEELDQQLDDRVEVAPFAGGKRRESTRDGERERAGDGERGALVVR